MRISVSIADDHIIVLTGLEKLLKGCPEIEIYDTTLNGDELLKALQQRRPDVLLLDIQMPGKQGDELAKLIRQLYPSISILVLTNMDQPFHVRNMFLNGVNGYLLKSAGQKTLIDAITAVYKGQQYLDVSLQYQMNITDRKAKDKHLLTTRELDIMKLVAKGDTNSEIAKTLYLSIRTVERHRNNLFFKLDVKNAAELVQKGIHFGLLK